MNGQKIWSEILSDVKGSVSASAFRTWFLGSRALDYRGDKKRKLLVVGVKNNFLKEHLENRYGEIVLERARERVGEVEVKFVVQQRENIAGRDEPLFSGVSESVLVRRKAEMLSPNYTFDNFVVGASNNLCYLASKQVSSGALSSYNPLFIYGPTGVGKTHLLQAIGNEFVSKVRDARTLYVSSEKFTNDYLESLSNRTQAAFRSKYRSVDLLLTDDIQFLAGKESTQDEFFYTFNELVLSGRQVVIVSDRHPRELGRVKERLVSRFLGGLTVDIGLPDLEMKYGILSIKCKERGVKLDEGVLWKIAESCEGGARELEGALISILSQGIANVNSSSVERAVGDAKFTASLNKSVAPGQIIHAACKHFGVRRADVLGKSRKSKISFARQVAMYLLREELELPLNEIGHLFGGRDHATVIHSVNKIKDRIVKNIELRDEVLRIKKVFN